MIKAESFHYNLKNFLSNTVSLTDLTVQIVFNGGINTLKAVFATLENKIPVILIAVIKIKALFDLFTI